MDLQAAARKILENLDLRAEYAAIGVRFAADQPSTSGWLSCHAFGSGDGDRNPSAGVNVSGEHPQRGRYKEFTGDGRNASLFEFAASIAGRFATWQEARKHYAGIAGVNLPGGEGPKLPADHLVFRSGRQHQIRAWCLTKPPIAEWAAIAGGATIAGWPATSQQYTVVALPVYGPHLLDDDPTGFVIWNKTGRPLPLVRKGGEPRYEKMLTVAGSKGGWMNRFGLARLAAAEVVWKTEGPSDCLALQSAIPEALRERHVVITNSGGAGEGLREEFWDHLAGKTVYILHDCDVPGQKGAEKQSNLAAAAAEEVRNVVLPYTIEPKHGKDVRDWLAEGGSYEGLLAMAEAAAVVPKPEPKDVGGQPAAATGSGINGHTNGSGDPLGHDREICRCIGLDVLGERATREIVVYAQGKTSTIGKISQLKHADLLQIAGPLVRDCVHLGGEAHQPGSHHFDRVREAIAVLAGQQRLYDQTARGAGVWPGRAGRFVLVGAREAAVWDASGGTLERIERPKADGLLLDLDSCEPWFDYQTLSGLIRESEDYAWRQDAIDDLKAILDLWRWKGGNGTSTLLAGLVLATWLQAAWQWRPHVALVGESQCGKSTLLETVLFRLFGRLGQMCNKPSEAGLRQSIKGRSCAILIDEFETDYHRRRVLELLRTSGTGSRILRGTAGQGGIEFGLKHICWVGAIEVGTDRQPDANRYLSFEILPPTTETRRAFILPAGDEITDLGQRLLAVAIRCGQQAIDLAAALRTHQIDGFDARAIESLSVPAAMLAAAMDLSGPAAVEMLEYLARLVESDQTRREPDQVQLMHAILGSNVTLDRGRIMSVGQLLSASVGDFPGDADEVLERVGVAVVADSNAPRAFTSARSGLFLEPKLIRRHLLHGTPWADQSIDTILLRLEGAERAKRRFNGTRAWGVEIEWSSFEQQFFAEEEAEASL